MKPFSKLASTLLILLIASGSPLHAQSPGLRVAAGGVVPLFSMAENYNIGVNGTISISHGLRDGGFGVRAELWGARFIGKTIVTDYARVHHSDFWSAGLLGNVAYVLQRKDPQPYFLLGGGSYRQLRDDGHDPYGWTAGVQAGAGLSLPVSELRLSAEIQYQVVFSDLVAGCGFCVASQLPLMVGMKW